MKENKYRELNRRVLLYLISLRGLKREVEKCYEINKKLKMINN